MSDLDDILVVSVEHAVAAPYATCKLADAGARVIKVERPGGDFAREYDRLVHGHSAYFVWINRGKESICLDLKSAEDVAILVNMIEQADVFVQNLGPGTLDRLGIPISALRACNPSLITCSISGYGSEGPARDQKAYDLLIQAETGLAAINGTEDGPARVGVSVCDIAAGMTALQAILQGLYARQRTGQGRDIEVSLFHSMADWMNVPYLQYRYGGKAPQRMGLKHPTIAPYGAFECADGKLVLISIQNNREWQRFCKSVLEAPDLSEKIGWRTNEERVANRPVVDNYVAKCFSDLSRDDAIEKLKGADIAFGRLSDLNDLISHPQHNLLKVLVDGQEVETLAPGATVKGASSQTTTVPRLDGAGPALRIEFASLKKDIAGE